MFRLIVLFFFVITLQARQNSETFRIIANKINDNNSIITAQGEVVITSPSYYITSNKAVYDRNSSTLELIGNVSIIKNNYLLSISDYSFLDLKKEIEHIKPVLLIDRNSKVWLNGENGKQIKNQIYLKNGTVSSCNCYNPAWQINFNKAKYNKKEKWFDFYNNHLYVKGIPFYLFLIPAVPYVEFQHLLAVYLLTNPPYFGFSTDKTRRSGLLRPTFGYGKKDGYFYMQPIYFAPKPNYDIEFIPQIRTRRGKGYEIKYRFADSPYSMLQISGGNFFEKQSYYKENKLINKRHWGWDLKYKRDKLLSKDNSKDGLYLYMQNMNDIEYKNTKYKSNSSSNQFLESKMQYFWTNNPVYVGFSLKHFKDLSKTNNDNTLQLYPESRFHKYSSNLFFNRLFYGIDLKYKNYFRKKEINAKIKDLYIPINYNRYILDNYINFGFSESMRFIKIDYSNDANNYEDATFIQNQHKIDLNLDLIKQFAYFTHNINFDIAYSYPRIVKQEGDIYGVNSDDTSLKTFLITKSKKTLHFGFKQHFYNTNLDEVLAHYIKQDIIYPKNYSSKLANLENEIIFYFKYGKISNRLLYNHQDKMVISSSYYLEAKKDNLYLKVNYLKQKDKSGISGEFSYRDLNDSKSLTYEIGNKVFKYYTLSYKEQKDLVKKVSNLKEYHLKIDKKCWSLDLTVKDNLVATATQTQKARRQNIYYITLELKPIGQVKHVYIAKEREE